ncbi:sugar-transfer associated ATP-grasp domain-containing protein [Zobellia nedashkovskayae]|uniref:sugar-transfer associated ATP-grasp domain-containing protein n=1 Tax=Zobellia nedashkovskayae TaxID=2779510 RepID=UPI00188C2FC8|nr:sugar-transfer associated ATP-grasp domain-containing protein [Zobellia nedashkovskayae]
MAIHFTNPGRIKVFLKDPKKKGILKILKEVFVLWTTRKEVPMYYFKHLYKKEVKNYKDYLSTDLNNRIQRSPKLNKQEYTSILNNKLNFALYCEKHKLATPKLIGHNFGKSFFLENGICEISTLNQLMQAYEAIFQSTPAKAIFFRPLSLYGGKGCFKLSKENLQKKLQLEYENLISGNYAHTEVIAQHPEINAIYSKSINTLRILTHMENGEVDIITSSMRFGAKGNVVDNTSSGGLTIGINQKIGTLKQTAYFDIEFGGEQTNKHPDTDFVLQNFKIPYYKEACKLVKNASKHIPNGMVGWDVAITPYGPILIEGNEDPSLYISDILEGGLLKNSKMLKMIARI